MTAAGVEIAPIGRDRHQELARFTWLHNRRADGLARCLHSGNGDEDVATTLAGIAALADAECCFLGADASGDGPWAGVIGCECDTTLSRAWTRGPLVANENEAARGLRAALIGALVDALPQLARFDAFVQCDEAPLLQSYLEFGFRRRSDYHVMSVRDAEAPSWPDGVADARPAHHDAIAALHAAAFPGTYLPAEQMLAAVDADRRLLVAEVDGAFAGYLYLQHKRAEHEGYVDFVAVAPQRRGQDVGGRLLRAALHWALEQRALRAVSLTVDSTRLAAQKLYLRHGFTAVSSGAHLSWERSGATAPTLPAQPA